MSRYFDALNRLRKTRGTAALADLRLADEVETPPASGSGESDSGRGLPIPELQLASRQTSYSVLLDLLRAASKSAKIPAVVIAGVSGEEPVREVIAGIAFQAKKRGVSVKYGHLAVSAGSRVLRLSSYQEPPRETLLNASTERGYSLHLSGSLRPDALARWLEDAAADSEILIMEGPAISSSVDAAFLGDAGGGLVVVAEALVTKSAALQEAVDRVRLTGCKMLGIVLTGTRRWLPRWIERVLGLFS